jgi:serine/threonine protein phosphatase PrpC
LRFRGVLLEQFSLNSLTRCLGGVKSKNADVKSKNLPLLGKACILCMATDV